MKVFTCEVIQEYAGITNGKANDGFEDDMERFHALRRFHDLLERVESIPRSAYDAAVIPVKRDCATENFSFDKEWACPSCGYKLGDCSTKRGHSQVLCEYCPDCGKRINWPAATTNILRHPAFVAADALYGILGKMKESRVPSESALADYLMTNFTGKETDCIVSDQAASPILKTVSTPAFVDYMDDDGKMTGELVDGKHDEYQCPVCGWFVDSHDFPFLYELGEMGKKKPCRFCMDCGQRIDWSGIHLDPEKYELNF